MQSTQAPARNQEPRFQNFQSRTILRDRADRRSPNPWLAANESQFRHPGDGAKLGHLDRILRNKRWVMRALVLHPKRSASTAQEIAAYQGMAVRTVERTLARLKLQGFLSNLGTVIVRDRSGRRIFYKERALRELHPDKLLSPNVAMMTGKNVAVTERKCGGDDSSPEYKNPREHPQKPLEQKARERATDSPAPARKPQTRYERYVAKYGRGVATREREKEQTDRARVEWRIAQHTSGFSRGEICRHILEQAARFNDGRADLRNALGSREIEAIAATARRVVKSLPENPNPDAIEIALTAIDEYIFARLQSHHPDRVDRILRESDTVLASYRGRMKAKQFALVERQYLQRGLLDEFGLSRFSLFYMAS